MEKKLKVYFHPPPHPPFPPTDNKYFLSYTIFKNLKYVIKLKNKQQELCYPTFSENMAYSNIVLHFSFFTESSLGILLCQYVRGFPHFLL